MQDRSRHDDCFHPPGVVDVLSDVGLGTNNCFLLSSKTEWRSEEEEKIDTGEFSSDPVGCSVSTIGQSLDCVLELPFYIHGSTST